MLPTKAVKNLKKYFEVSAYCKLCRYCPPEYESICRNCLQNGTLTNFKENKEIENDTD